MKPLLAAPLVLTFAASMPTGCQVQHPPLERFQPTYIYTVEEGDINLEAVARKVYGDASLWKHIAGANPNADPRALRAGQELTIPKLTGRPAPRGCDRMDIY